jgi:hypothetical protein
MPFALIELSTWILDWKKEAFAKIRFYSQRTAAESKGVRLIYDDVEC